MLQVLEAKRLRKGHHRRTEAHNLLFVYACISWTVDNWLESQVRERCRLARVRGLAALLSLVEKLYYAWLSRAKPAASRGVTFSLIFRLI